MKRLFMILIVIGLIFNLSFYVGCSFSREPTGSTDGEVSTSGENSESGSEEDSTGSSGTSDSSSDSESKKIFYTVKFYNEDKLVSEQKIEEGNLFEKPSDLKDEFDEYEFIGWMKDGETEVYDFSLSDALVADSNLVFRAKWEKIEYTPWVK